MADQRVIENKFNAVLDGDALKNALDFAAFLHANNLSPDCHESGHGWSIMRADESIGFISVNVEDQITGPWTIWFNSCDFNDFSDFSDFDDFDDFGDLGDLNGGALTSVEVKESAWAHSSICGNFASGGKDCGCGDQPGFHRVIFGREFENRCHSPLMFKNPDAKTLAHVKTLMLMLK